MYQQVTDIHTQIKGIILNQYKYKYLIGSNLFTMNNKGQRYTNEYNISFLKFKIVIYERGR